MIIILLNTRFYKSFTLCCEEKRKRNAVNSSGVLIYDHFDHIIVGKGGVRTRLQEEAAKLK